MIQLVSRSQAVRDTNVGVMATWLTYPEPRLQSDVKSLVKNNKRRSKKKRSPQPIHLTMKIVTTMRKLLRPPKNQERRRKSLESGKQMGRGKSERKRPLPQGGSSFYWLWIDLNQFYQSSRRIPMQVPRPSIDPVKLCSCCWIPWWWSTIREHGCILYTTRQVFFNAHLESHAW